MHVSYHMKVKCHLYILIYFLLIRYKTNNNLYLIVIDIEISNKHAKNNLYKTK